MSVPAYFGIWRQEKPTIMKKICFLLRVVMALYTRFLTSLQSGLQNTGSVSRALTHASLPGTLYRVMYCPSCRQTASFSLELQGLRWFFLRERDCGPTPEPEMSENINVEWCWHHHKVKYYEVLCMLCICSGSLRTGYVTLVTVSQLGVTRLREIVPRPKRSY